MTAYWRERFSLDRFLPGAGAIALAASAADGGGAIDFCINVLLALLLLAQFRVWDDLADRERDRIAHPARVMVVARSVAPFVAQTVAVGIVCLQLVQVSAGPAAARALLVLNLAVGAYYLCRPAHRTIASDLLLLAKYPAFVVVLAGTSGQPVRVATAAAIVYAAACAFEAWHDASGPLRCHNS